MTKSRRKPTPDWVPTEAEIRAACWEIQAEWSARERAIRAGHVDSRGNPVRVSVRVVRTSETVPTAAS